MFYNQKTLKRQDSEHVQLQRKKLKSLVQSKVETLFVKELGILKQEQIQFNERFISSSTTDLVSVNSHSADYIYIDTDKLNTFLTDETILSR